MRVILDENLPVRVKDILGEMDTVSKIVDVNQEHKGILDLELVGMMDSDDILVTGDRELHRNILKLGGRSVYYDVQLDNYVEINVKVLYYLKGHTSGKVHATSPDNRDVSPGPNETLRRRFEEMKEENARLKVRLNVLEGKLSSVLATARSALDEEQRY